MDIKYTVLTAVPLLLNRKHEMRNGIPYSAERQSAISIQLLPMSAADSSLYV